MNIEEGISFSTEESTHKEHEYSYSVGQDVWVLIHVRRNIWKKGVVVSRWIDLVKSKRLKGWPRSGPQPENYITVERYNVRAGLRWYKRRVHQVSAENPGSE